MKHCVAPALASTIAPRSGARRARPRPGLRAAAGAGLLLAGCTQPEATPRSPAVFGGQGAKMATLDEKPLPPAESAAATAGPCGKEAPPNETALLDDFEDGDNKLFKGFEREGYWFSASDKTEGSVLKPSGEFTAELLPGAEAARENHYAAHLVASGEKQWGATWGTSLVWTRKGIRCPLNISRFDGVRFRAKGPGTIQAALSVPEVMAKEYGGLCADRCYDFHGKVFTLSDHWESYLMRWDRLQQGGWGTEARFTPSRIVQFNIKVEVKNLPIDFWVDDVELIRKDVRATANP